MATSDAFRASPPTDLAFLITQIENLEARLGVLEGPSREQSFQVVSKLPITDMNVVRVQGFALTNAWATYATASLTVPAGKRLAKLLGIGSGAALDMTSGGVTSSDCRVIVNGSASGVFPASKDAGASVVNNVLKGEMVTTASVAPGDVLVFEFQMKALSATAFSAQAQNFAQITALGVFSS